MEDDRFAIEGADDDMGDDDMGDEENPRTERRGSVRYDPAVLFYRLSSTDWRDGAGVNADGLQAPAVQQGKISFLTNKPNIDGLTNFNEGGKAPYDFTAHRIACRLFFPVQPSDQGGRITLPAPANTPNIYNPRGIQLAQILMRGRFFLDADNAPIFQDLPIDTIGAAGGFIILGGSDSATGQNMGTSRRDGFPLPDPMKLKTGGPTLKAYIQLSPLDVAYLGAGAGAGVGAPLPQDAYQIDGVPPATTAVIIPPARIMLSLEFWGRRGLDVQAGSLRAPRKPRARK